MNDDALVRELQSVTQRPGPHVSLYLNTEAERELGPQEMESRWRNLRDQVDGGTVPDKALLLLDDVVDGAHRKGDGLVAIASGEEISFRRFLGSPVPDSISMGALPHLLPLFDHRQGHPTYGIVLIDRTGAEIHVVDDMSDEEVIEVEGDHDELRKVGPGGWSQRRFQNRADDSWERNAEKVADRLARIVQAEGLDLVVVMGDVRAKALLLENAAPDIQPILHDLDTAPPTTDQLDVVRAEVEAAVAALVGRTVDATIERFLEERGQDDLAADGIEATFAALRMSQVETLLVTAEGVDDDAWFVTSDPTQGATQRSALEDLGPGNIGSAPTDDVLVRMALGTGAAIRIIPPLSWDRGPKHGVGAILRYRTASGPPA